MTQYCYCGARSAVIDSRFGENVRIGPFIRRRRRCPNGHRYTTYEIQNAMIDAIVDQIIGMGKMRAALTQMFNLPDPLGLEKIQRTLSNKKKPDTPSQITQNMRACEKCGKSFIARNASAKYCSANCRQIGFVRSRRKAVEMTTE